MRIQGSLSSCPDLVNPEEEKVVDSVSFTRRKYLGNSDLAEIFSLLL